MIMCIIFFFFFSSRRRHTRWNCDWSSDVCSSDLGEALPGSPADEMPRMVAVGGFAAGEPLIEIGLAACAQGEFPGGQPAEQGDGGADMLQHDVVLLAGGGLAVVPAAEPAHQ